MEERERERERDIEEIVFYVSIMLCHIGKQELLKHFGELLPNIIVIIKNA